MNILRLVTNSASKALGSTSVRELRTTSSEHLSSTDMGAILSRLRHSDQVRELGTPTMPLPSPDIATKKATFGMS